MRMIVSDAATIKKVKDKNDKVVMINDISRASFEAPMRRNVCVELLRKRQDMTRKTRTWSDGNR